MKLKRKFFEEKVILVGFWAPRSPDLSPADFFLWGLLKDVVHKNQPTILEELPTDIEMAIHSTDENMLRNAFENLLRRMNACLDINEG